MKLSHGKRRACAQMRETIGEARPTMNFGEKLGDAQARQRSSTAR
jgi:hypothetical protein